MNTPSVGARFVKEAPMTAAARTLGCAIAVALDRAASLRAGCSAGIRWLPRRHPGRWCPAGAVTQASESVASMERTCHSTLRRRLISSSVSLTPRASYLVGIIQMASRTFTLFVLLATVCLCPNTSADDSATGAPERSGELRFTLDELELRTQWSGLDDQQAGEIIRGNLYGLIRAVNAYQDVNGVLPPAVVPNANIPAEKRLSGLVLLLPYLRRLTYFKDGTSQRQAAE